MIHPPDCGCDTYGCRLRRKGVQVAPGAMPSRHNRVPPRKNEVPNYNRQIVGEHRRGGTFMPFINPDGEPIRRKQWEHQRHELTDSLRALRNNPGD